MFACRTCLSLGEAGAVREEAGKCTGWTRRGTGPSTSAQTVELTSGRANSQQGLTATCKDPGHERIARPREGFGLTHEPVRAMKEG
jgi:hypothetical protein